MGLDMYLGRRPKQEVENVGYWRKANAIHKWFGSMLCDDGFVEDCKEYVVTKDMLEQLLADCLDVIQHPNHAAEVLPTQEGFFWGDIVYDDWYFDSLKDTVEIINKVLAETDFDKEEIVYSSWW